MFLPFNSVSEWPSVSESPFPFTATDAYGDGTVNPGNFKVAIFTGNGTITANKDIDLNIICVGGGGGGSNSAASSSTNRLGGGGGGVVIVTRRMTKRTTYVVTVGGGGSAGTAGGHSSISNAASGFIVQGDGGGGGFLSNTDVTAGGKGHPYSININNPVTGGNSEGNTTIDTSTATGRPAFIGPDGSTSISITTVLPAIVKTLDTYLIVNKYSGGGGTSRSRPAGPGKPGKDGVGGSGPNRTGIAATGESASTIGSGGGGAGASSGINISGGAGYSGIVIVWVAY